jgi:DNA-binding FadR family transcriptional regulator
VADSARNNLDPVTELKAIHLKVTTGMADLIARRITPKQLNEISRIADRRIKKLEKRMKRDSAPAMFQPQ